MKASTTSSGRPTARSIAYTATEPKSAALKDREKKYGEFQVVEQDYRMTQLFVLDLASRATPRADERRVHRRQLLNGRRTAGAIAFDHRVNPSPGFVGSADISLVTVADGIDSQARRRRKVRTHNPVWSPDGIAHRVPDRDGEPGVLLRQQHDRDRAGRRAARRPC